MLASPEQRADIVHLLALQMAGITKKNNYLVSQTESRLIDSFMHEPLPYTEQIDKHQAIVYADGW